jgi:hypothetical protein
MSGVILIVILWKSFLLGTTFGFLGLLLEGDLLVGLAVGAPVISSRKIVKRTGLLLRGAFEVVLELAISEVEEKLTIRKGSLSFVGLARRRRRDFVALGNPSWDPHLSKRDVPSCKGRKHSNTSSSPRASFISIPELTFLCGSHRG